MKHSSTTTRSLKWEEQISLCDTLEVIVLEREVFDEESDEFKTTKMLRIATMTAAAAVQHFEMPLSAAVLLLPMLRAAIVVGGSDDSDAI